VGEGVVAVDALEQFHVSWKHEIAPAFFCSHFRTENRIPLFLKVL
jgi:hypothetical protein